MSNSISKSALLVVIQNLIWRLPYIWGCVIFSLRKFRWQEGLENVSARSMERFNSKERRKIRCWCWREIGSNVFFQSSLSLASFPVIKSGRGLAKVPKWTGDSEDGNDESHFGIISPNFLCCAFLMRLSQKTFTEACFLYTNFRSGDFYHDIRHTNNKKMWKKTDFDLWFSTLKKEAKIQNFWTEKFLSLQNYKLLVYNLTTRWRLSWVVSYVREDWIYPSELLEIKKKSAEIKSLLALNKSFETPNKFRHRCRLSLNSNTFDITSRWNLTQ